MHLRLTPRRPVRRSTALALGGLLLAAPVLSSCGFDYATDRVYTPANGVNERSASIDVLGAVIVSAHEGSGTFVATLSNNDPEKPGTVESMSGEDLQFANFDPIEIDPLDAVILSNDDKGINVTGDFSAGDFEPMTVTFGDGTEVSFDVLVVDDTGYYDGIDGSTKPEDAPSGEVQPSEVAGSPAGGVEPAEPPSPTGSDAP